MVVPVGVGHDGEAPVFVERGTVVIMTMFALYCDKNMCVTILPNLILIVGTETSQGRFVSSPPRVLEYVLLRSQ